MAKNVGIIGGMGSRASSNLINRIVEYCPAKTDQDYIEFILHNNSLIPDRTESIVYRGASPMPELIRSVNLMNRNSVDFIIMACITAYHYYPELLNHAKSEILNPVLVLKRLLIEQFPHCRNIGILATTGSLQSGIFDQLTIDTDFQLVTLNSSEQEELFMNSIYGELGMKSYKPSSQAVEDVRMSASVLIKNNADLVIGGCTEVSLAIKPNSLNVPFIDLVDLLATETVKRCYQEEYA